MTLSGGGFMRDALRAARKERGLSARDLAARLNVEHSTILRWENGIRTPPIDTALRIARLLELPPEVAWGVDLSGVDPLPRAM